MKKRLYSIFIPILPPILSYLCFGGQCWDFLQVLLFYINLGVSICNIQNLIHSEPRGSPSVTTQGRLHSPSTTTSSLPPSPKSPLFFFFYVFPSLCQLSFFLFWDSWPFTFQYFRFVFHFSGPFVLFCCGLCFRFLVSDLNHLG